MTEWWTSSQGGWIGGLGGSGIGLLGALLGCLAGICAPRGKLKGLVLGLAGGLVALGLVCLVTGIAALILRQPYHVWYPLALAGFILTFVCGGLLPVLLLRYRQAEARRMQAQDLRRS
jgi:hypothetical protein